ncbi:MAG: AAA family ATPase [Bacillota bacterium]
MAIDLRSIWFLSELDEGQIHSLAVLCVTRRYGRGTRLFAAGDPAPGLFLLLSGSVKLTTMTEEGQERIQSIRGAGESIGEEGLVDDRPLEVTAEALSETVALLIPREQFQARLSAMPALGLAMARVLADRLRQTADASRDVLTLDARRRIIKQVILLAERSPDGTLPPLRQQELASLAGAARETVSRVMTDLTHQGYLESVGRRFRVTDLAGLRDLVAVSQTESARGLHKASPAWPGGLPPSDPSPELRLITVLFAEMDAGPSPSPEASYQLSERFRSAVTAALDRYGGHVQGLYGGTAVAVFGAPQPREQAARSACRAALEIRVALTDLPAGTGVRVALWSGEAVVALRAGGCVVSGDPIHRVSQLVRQVPGGEVWVGPTTRELAERGFAFAPVDGFPASEAVRLERPYTADEQQQEGPFVARGAEMALLLAELDRVKSGESRGALVIGEAGIGKSRLVSELMRHPSAGGLRWAVGRAAVYGQESPYFLLTDLLRELQRYPDLEAPARRWLEELKGRSRPAADRTEHQKELARGLNVLLRGADPPVALVLEDLHWADGPSLAVLALLRPALRIGTARPGLQIPWPCDLTLRLEPLTDAEGVDLARALLPGAELPNDLARMLVGRTGGNPFFLEETVAGLERAGALLPQGGQWRLVSDPSGSALIPASVQEGLTARVGQLAPQERQVIQAAAVIGVSFSPGAIRRMLSFDPLAALHRLAELRFVRSENRFWSFRHAVTREAVYGTLTAERRRALHRRAAEAMGDQAEPAERAHHLALAGEHRAAAAAWEEAGDRAESLGLMEMAATQYGLAEAALAAIGEPIPPRLALALGHSLLNREPGRAERYLQQVLSMAADPDHRARAWLGLSLLATRRADRAGGLEAVARARAELAAASGRTPVLEAQLLRITARLLTGWATARGLLAQALGLLPPPGSDPEADAERIWLLLEQTRGIYFDPEPDRYAASAREALELARAMGSRRPQYEALRMATGWDFLQGRFRPSVEGSDLAASLMEGTGDEAALSNCLGDSVLSVAFLGEVTDALVRARKAARIRERIGIPNPTLHLFAAVAALIGGQQEALAEHLECYDRFSRGGPPRALHVFQRLSRGDLSGAASLLPDLPPPEEEMPPLRTLVARAEVARLQGDHQRARAILAEEAAFAAARQVRFALLDAHVRQAELELEAGEAEAAERFARAAAAIETDSPYLAGRTLRVRGQVALERGEIALARSLLERAVVLLEATEVEPERALAHQLLGRATGLPHR